MTIQMELDFGIQILHYNEHQHQQHQNGGRNKRRGWLYITRYVARFCRPPLDIIPGVFLFFSHMHVPNCRDARSVLFYFLLHQLQLMVSDESSLLGGVDLYFHVGNLRSGRVGCIEHDECQSRQFYHQHQEIILIVLYIQINDFVSSLFLCGSRFQSFTESE